MSPPMFLYFALILCASTSALPAQPNNPQAAHQGWIKLFDGSTLSGWTAPDPGEWQMKDGVLEGRGKVSHLFSPEEYRNLEFKAEVKLNKGGNSGMYFRAAQSGGWPKGYEAQVNNSSGDPRKTGSLYALEDVKDQLVPDDTWWTQHIIAVGNRIIIKVNGKIVVDYVDAENRYKSGLLAFQQHDPASVVHYRNVAVKKLPDDEQAAWTEVRKENSDVPEKSAGDGE